MSGQAATAGPLGLAVALRAGARRTGRPHVAIGLVLLAAMAVLVVAPISAMLQTTLAWQPEDVRVARDVDPGAFTMFHWVRVFTGPVSEALLYRPLWNSMVTSTGVALLGVAIGAALAWLAVRTDLPGRRHVRWAAIVPFMLPSWPIALAWLVVFKNDRIGGAHGLWQYVTGEAPPDWLVFGAVPIVLTLALHYYAFAFLLVSGALASMDGRLEEAAEVLGAGRARILRRVVVPLLLPALLSAFILTFSRALGTFGTPFFLGGPVRYYTLPTMIFSNMVNRQVADAFVQSLVLIAVAVATIALNQRLIGSRRSFVTVGGQALPAKPQRLGAWRLPAALLVWGFLALAVVAPLGLLLWQSLMLVDGVYALDNLTLHFWIGAGLPQIASGAAGILRDPAIWAAAWNSLRLAVVTAVVTAVLGMLLGYAIVKGRGTLLARTVEQVSFLPYLMPSIAFAAVYLALFARPIGPFPALYGSFALLVLVSIVKNLPFSSRTGVTAMLQVAGDLEEAAVVAGASWWRRVRRILFPLTRGGFAAGLLLTYISTLRELSLVILLVTPGTQLLTTSTFRYAEEGFQQFGNAIVIVTVALVLAGLPLLGRLRGGDLGRSVA